MTKAIVVAVVAGILSGYFFVPEWFLTYTGDLITLGLCLILFLVGLDIGMQGTIWNDIKKVGFKIALVPIAIIGGTLLFGALASFVLPLTPRESMAVAAGMGWYSLAPMMLAEYSASLSAIAFLANVFREVFGILLIPVVAKYVGFVETVALPGAAAMDTCLPPIVGATSDRIIIYAMASGVVASMAVPLMINIIMGI